MEKKQRDWVWAIRKPDGKWYSVVLNQQLPVIFHNKPWVHKHAGEVAVKLRLVEFK